MTVTSQPAISLLDSVLQAEGTRTEMQVAVLKKAQDAATQQGEAMIRMLEESVPPVTGHGLDAYA